MGRTRLDRLRYGRRVDVIFAIGHLALRWFKMAGYAERILYPFVYTTETPEPGAAFSRDPRLPVRLLFVGQCVPRKGLDLLLAALAQLNGLDWTLDVVGDGADRLQLERQSQDLGLAGKVTFAGALANDEATRRIADADLLVLPSRWDGWGAVVNEALMRGVPVVCSDACAARRTYSARPSAEKSSIPTPCSPCATHCGAASWPGR